METKKPTILMILDGFGINPNDYGNAIAQANKPFIDELFKKYPNTTIGASGKDVGLPDGQMGNSEVGHLNIGAGRVVFQELTRITDEIDRGSFYENAVINEAIDHVKENDSNLHVFGLLSDGGVHSHIDHLKAILKLAADRGVSNLYVHCFLDGRDVPPRCADVYIEEIEKTLKKLGTGKIATVSGRYYAMDRDNRWERVKKAYDAIALGEGLYVKTASLAVAEAYERDESDEFVIPTVVDGATCVGNGDSVIMYNFRPDRAREITRAFTEENFNGFEREKLKDLYYVTMTQYDATLKNVHVAYPPVSLKNTLGEYVSSLGLKQLRIAETEKYAHVTFFFNGGVEEPNLGEDRILVPSPKVSTYDLKPEMSAYEVTDKVLENMEHYDLVILNFANADMVGHTGVMEAAIKAIEALDKCVEKIVKKTLELGGQILLTADHGNADVMLDEQGNIVTAHSLSRVPLMHIADKGINLCDGGKLADIAPTLLEMMNLDIPVEMTGHSLLKK